MIKKLAGEQWSRIKFPGSDTMRNYYAVSTHGRIASYKEDVWEDGKLLNGSMATGYRTLNLHTQVSKGTIYVHREIAESFLKKPSRSHDSIIHLNHDKMDNRVKNLKWVKKEEMLEHQQKSPAKIAYREEQATRQVGLKLNAAQVRKIKEQMAKTSRRMTVKQIAEKYGVSEMTIYRIKSGENWSRVK
ncbi:MAG: hypothetical protein JWP69_439 [Flaviaesturariibacter sp.]|nr:hypothetical protein [Flaviaesturariibacter sp.]